jgi:carbonic anhydrase
MASTNNSLAITVPRDLISGLVVFLVALPLCLGVALASGAPLLAGVLAGIVGGLLVGALSGSNTSVSGPAAGLTAVVAAQITELGSFSAFLLTVVLAGLIQIVMGYIRAGSLANFFPTSVIKGFLAAIGIILILKQIPHLFGHDPDPEGDWAFQQPDNQNTFSELLHILDDIHPGSTIIGVFSLVLLLVWDRWKVLKNFPLPGPLFVVTIGVATNIGFRQLGEEWVIGPSHLVQVPIAENISSFAGFLHSPDFSQWTNLSIYSAAFMLAAVASLETLLNLEAVDKLDPEQRNSPPNQELIAQGIGNLVSGLIGGLPITSVIVRSSVNINAGAKTKLSAVVHGLLLLLCVIFFPVYLNTIPLSCLAAILLVTGIKLVSPALIQQMLSQGKYQFIPFAATVIAIVFTDLLIGVFIGLVVSVGFILKSNMQRPLRRFMVKHIGSEVLHIELANQVSFLNRAALSKALDEVRSGEHVLLNAQNTNYIDPDVLDMLREYKEKTAPARGVNVSLVGFRSKYMLHDEVHFIDYSTRELQTALTPTQVLQILKDGHERFRTGRHLARDNQSHVKATSEGQFPLAAVLSCIDSRTPAELIFDLGVGDVFSVRIAGNITSPKVLGSIEYATAVAGAKLILVMGHTRCGAVTAAVNFLGASQPADQLTGCQHLQAILDDIQLSTDLNQSRGFSQLSDKDREQLVDGVARRNVQRVVSELQSQSETLKRLVAEGRIGIVGSIYNVATGEIEFLT